MQDSSLKEIFAFLAVLLVLIFVAAVIGHLGGKIGAAKLVSGNIGPLFDYQTTEASLGDNPQGINGNLLDDMKVVDGEIQTDIVSPNTMGIDEIVPIPEKKWLNDLKVEQGKMEFYLDVPEDLPMHLTEADLASWILWVDSTGGYEPFEIDDKFSQIKVYQKDRDGTGRDLVGIIKIIWQQGDYTPSNTYRWHAVGFDITYSNKDPAADPTYISLDSSYYPDVMAAPGSPDNDWYLYDHDLPQYIPKKEVDLWFKTLWSGCKQPDQSFLVISVRVNHQFPTLDIMPS
ncbi:MAG: hypothetical protein ACFFFG_09765 [Candidatus Thorarchaeota archaeon]